MKEQNNGKRLAMKILPN